MKNIIKILPHGSGINYDWEITTKGKRIYIRDAWDYMDEYRKIEYIGLRDYLETLFINVEIK